MVCAKEDCTIYKEGAFQREYLEVESGETVELVIYLHGLPRKNEPYTIELGSETLEGTTDENGKLSFETPNVSNGVLTIGEGVTAETIELQFSVFEDINQESGLITRLINLGYISPDNEPSYQLKNALFTFQAEYNLEVTGEITEETISKLHEIARN